MFSIHSLISITLISIGISFYIKDKIDYIYKYGLISVLPKNVKDLLLKRSLFDVLCDLWYLRSLMTYSKVITRPFVVNIEPGEAVRNLDDLNPTQRKAFLTKVKILS